MGNKVGWYTLRFSFGVIQFFDERREQREMGVGKTVYIYLFYTMEELYML